MAAMGSCSLVPYIISVIKVFCSLVPQNRWENRYSWSDAHAKLSTRIIAYNMKTKMQFVTHAQKFSACYAGAG